MAGDDRRWTKPGADGISYRLVRVPYCTCGTWDFRHESECGWEIDDSQERYVRSADESRGES